jgi:hypothetical protein
VMEWLAGVASLSTHGFLCADASWGIPIDLNPIDIKWHPGDYTRLQECIYRQPSLTCKLETLFRSFCYHEKQHSDLCCAVLVIAFIVVYGGLYIAQAKAGVSNYINYLEI